MSLSLRGVVSVALASLVLAGCGGGGSTATTTPAPASTGIADAHTPPATPEATVQMPSRAVPAKAGSPLTIWRNPGGDPQQVLPPKTSYGTALVVLVDHAEGAWIKVLLPTRPNGSTGWVKRTDVTLQVVQDAIEVDVTRHTITVTLAGQKPVTGSVAVGSTQNPTPTGRYYVTDKLAPKPATGAYGSIALGLSAHSPTLTEFGGGDGQIGVHGTSDQASVGKPVSHGCIRVAKALEPVLAQVPLGTPVTIT